MAALLIIIGGDRGNGFSVQAKQFEAIAAIPRLLREVADDIERQVRNS